MQLIKCPFDLPLRTAGVFKRFQPDLERVGNLLDALSNIPC